MAPLIAFVLRVCGVGLAFLKLFSLIFFSTLQIFRCPRVFSAVFRWRLLLNMLLHVHSKEFTVAAKMLYLRFKNTDQAAL